MEYEIILKSFMTISSPKIRNVLFNINMDRMNIDIFLLFAK
jgi:hypothetical protein